MELTRTQDFMLTAYGALWKLAKPLLKRNDRLKNGWDQRLVPDMWVGRCQLWIQAASGGEAYLAWELAKALSDRLPEGEFSSILLTSCTKQGIEVLEQVREWAAEHNPQLHCSVRYFPFDEPSLMRKALAFASPKAVVLLETELWPGLMAAAKRRGTPVLVVNGRMNTRSLAGYLATRGFWKNAAPQKVFAISEADARRFTTLFDVAAEQVPNIKFDRVKGKAGRPKKLSSVIKKNTSLLTLGSVREEEEGDVFSIILEMLKARPKTSIALVPRHMERVPAWEQRLATAGISYAKRSDVKEATAPGTVILWDTFGELDALYTISRAVFIGGTLAPVGGQNFLEPITHGIVPVIGPHYSNFAWAQPVIDEKLVHVMPDKDSVFEQLLKSLKRPADSAKTKKQFSTWIDAHKGGTKAAVDAVMELLER